MYRSVSSIDLHLWKELAEKITTFSCSPDFYLLLIKPRKGVSTAEAFHIVDEQEGIHPDCKAMQEALENNDYDGIIHSLGNSMENAAMILVPEIRKAKQDLLDLGFDGVLMSGSWFNCIRYHKRYRIVRTFHRCIKKEEILC